MRPNFTPEARALRRRCTNAQLADALTRKQAEHAEAQDRLRRNMGTEDEPFAREQVERTRAAAYTLRLALDIDPTLPLAVYSGPGRTVAIHVTEVNGTPATFRLTAEPAHPGVFNPLAVDGQAAARATALLLAHDTDGALIEDAKWFAAQILDEPGAPVTEQDVTLVRAAETIQTQTDGRMLGFIADARARA